MNFKKIWKYLWAKKWFRIVLATLVVLAVIWPGLAAQALRDILGAFGPLIGLLISVVLAWLIFKFIFKKLKIK